MSHKADQLIWCVEKTIFKFIMSVHGEEYIVDHYNSLDGKDFRNSNLFRLVSKMVSGNKVVEIGSGNGFFASLLIKSKKNVLGIEPSLEMINLSKRNYPKLRVISGYAEELDALTREKFDSVIMIDVLEHVEKDKDQILKIHNVLEANGEVILVVPAYKKLYGRRDKLMGHFRRYSQKDLFCLLEAGGFKVSFVRYWNALGVAPYFFYEKVLQKPLETSLRKEGGGFFSSIIKKFFWFWFKYIENNFDFGFGLSLIIIGKKIQ